jgi:hypothetical protein
MSEGVPGPILTALLKPQERRYLLYLESELIEFTKSIGGDRSGSGVQSDYVIKAHHLKNSYYRLLSHQLCQYYHLSHANNQFNEIVVSAIGGVDYDELLESKVCRLSAISVLLNRDSLAEKVPVKPSPKIIIKKDFQKPIESIISTNESSPILACTKDVSKIETDRASKEALYLKVRQEIFDASYENDEDDDADDDDDNDDDKSTESEHTYDFSDDSNDDNNDDQINDSIIRDLSRHHGSSTYHTNYHTAAAYPPIPLTMPMSYPLGVSQYGHNLPYPSGSPYSPGTPFPPSSQYLPNPQYHQTSHNVAFNGHFPPYYYPPVMQPNGWYPSPYDKETERRLLNNPYIIIPETRPQYKKNSTSTKKSPTSASQRSGHRNQEEQTNNHPNHTTKAIPVADQLNDSNQQS